MTRANEAMKMVIELAFREYSKKKDSITEGFITSENIKWVTDHLFLRNLTNKELSEMWETIDEYFLDKTAVYDDNHEVIGWKPGKRFEFDTDSAWKEVVNAEARRRKAEGTL